MRKIMTIFGVILFASAILTSCGKKASDYEGIVKEYKMVLCVVMDKNNGSMSDVDKALQRQQELNKEFDEAIKNLSQDEKSKLFMSWSNAVAEVTDGKCD
jgi:hypothetical protein